MKFTSRDWFDGRFGTDRGEEAGEHEIVEAKSWADGFRKLHGFLPSSAKDSRGRAKGNWKPEPGTGFRYVNAESLSLNAQMHTIVQYDDFMPEHYGIKLVESDGEVAEVIKAAEQVRKETK